jgi:hypothetical protein
MKVTRRGVFKSTVAAFVAGVGWVRSHASAAPDELKVSDNVPTHKFDLGAKEIEGWTVVDGQWAVEDMAGAPSGLKVGAACDQESVQRDRGATWSVRRRRRVDDVQADRRP